MFDYILLDCIIKLNAERTMYNIYHLLHGRKSTQTLQDRNIFDLSAYYGIYRTIHRHTFEKIIQKLKEKNYILLSADQSLHITTDGYDAYIKKGKSINEFLFLNGSEYGNQAYMFSNSLQLFLQLVTHMYKGENRFIPIIEDVTTQHFIKNVWHQNKKSSNQILHMIFHDLYSVLKVFPSAHAECFVDSLTTYKKIGLSNLQLAQKYDISPYDAHLFFYNIIHYICRKIEEKQAFQFINKLCGETSLNKELTLSSEKTLALISNGYTAEEIAEFRQLKMNTILDHIIEIAYAHPDMEWDSFITDQEFALINQTVKQLSTKKLKDIKQHLPESISYFQIKLVLALDKRIHGGE